MGTFLLGSDAWRFFQLVYQIRCCLANRNLARSKKGLHLAGIAFCSSPKAMQFEIRYTASLPLFFKSILVSMGKKTVSIGWRALQCGQRGDKRSRSVGTYPMAETELACQEYLTLSADTGKKICCLA